MFPFPQAPQGLPAGDPNISPPNIHAGFEPLLYADGTYRYRCIMCKSKWAKEDNIPLHLQTRTHINKWNELQAFQNQVAQSSQYSQTQASSLPHNWNHDPSEPQVQINPDDSPHQTDWPTGGPGITQTVDVDVNNPEGFGFGSDYTGDVMGGPQGMAQWLHTALAAGLMDEEVLFPGDADLPNHQFVEAVNNSSWFSFRSKLEYLVSALMLGHCLSRTMYHQLRVILTLLGIELPHWDSIKRKREFIRKGLDIKIHKHVSLFDNTFYYLSLIDMIQHVSG